MKFRYLSVTASIVLFSMPANAASIKLDKTCYLTKDNMKITGDGFLPDRKVYARLDSSDFGDSARTDASGSFVINRAEIFKGVPANNGKVRTVEVTVRSILDPSAGERTTASTKSRVTNNYLEFSVKANNPFTEVSTSYKKARKQKLFFRGAGVQLNGNPRSRAAKKGTPVYAAIWDEKKDKALRTHRIAKIKDDCSRWSAKKAIAIFKDKRVKKSGEYKLGVTTKKKPKTIDQIATVDKLFTFK